MKAIHVVKYGHPAEVLKLLDVEKPVPGDDEVLVKVHAASANTLDLQLRGGLARIWSGPRRPKDPRIGADVAGQVEAVGSRVTRFRPGDEVFGVGKGAFAEYAATREGNLALKPANCSFEEAAAAPVAALTALQGLRDSGQIRPGQRVVINGASGGVGSYAVQIAKSFGAEVTAVCSPGNMETARRTGADHVVDYTCEDFTRKGERYDLILTVNGYHPIFAYRRALCPTGTYIMAGSSHNHVIQAIFEAMLLGPLISRRGGQKLTFMGIAKVNPKDLDAIAELLKTGKVLSVIDRRYPLSETAAALTYLGEGHARGKVVISIRADPR